MIILPRVTLVKSLGYWPFGEIGCRLLSNFVDYTFLNSGILLVMLLSWDRYQMLVISYSEYLNKHTKKYLLKAITIAWLLSAFQGAVENITWTPILSSLLYQPNFDYVCVPPSLLTFSGVVTNLAMKIISVIAVGAFGVLIVMQLHKRLMKWQRVGPESTVNEESTAPKQNTTRSTSIANEPAGTSNETHNIVNDSNSDLNEDNKGQIKNLASNPNAPQPSQQTQQQQPQQQQQQQVGQDNTSRFHKRYTKPIVTYVLLVLSLLVCNLPLYTYTLIVQSCMECRSIYTGAILNYLTCLLYFNSCLNPLLYGFTNTRIRGFYQRKLKL